MELGMTRFSKGWGLRTARSINSSSKKGLSYISIKKNVFLRAFKSKQLNIFKLIEYCQKQYQ